jgi:3'-phosphoadenosine 5'-phosphosulfate sulfotransferase (PAPS reductase)/FAD synthetase
MSSKLSHPDLEEALKIIRARRNFNADSWINAKVKLLNEYLTKNNLSGIVVNLSGGIDSSVTIALCQKASSLPNSPLKKIIGIQQPIHVFFIVNFSIFLEYTISSEACYCSCKSTWNRSVYCGSNPNI